MRLTRVYPAQRQIPSFQTSSNLHTARPRPRPGSRVKSPSRQLRVFQPLRKGLEPAGRAWGSGPEARWTGADRASQRLGRSHSTGPRVWVAAGPRPWGEAAAAARREGGEGGTGKGGAGRAESLVPEAVAASPTKEEEGGEGGWSKLGVGAGASRSGSPRTVGERRLLLEVVGSGAGLRRRCRRLRRWGGAGSGEAWRGSRGRGRAGEASWGRLSGLCAGRAGGGGGASHRSRGDAGGWSKWRS